MAVDEATLCTFIKFILKGRYYVCNQLLFADVIVLALGHHLCNFWCFTNELQIYVARGSFLSPSAYLCESCAQRRGYTALFCFLGRGVGEGCS
jgi:hypothetical protein